MCVGLRGRLLFCLSVALIICLLFQGIHGVIPVQAANALSFDIWTNKGGEGPVRPGGTFEVGEETVIYARATANVQAERTIQGPSYTNKDTLEMQAGVTYQWSLGKAEQKDIGDWTITLGRTALQRWQAVPRRNGQGYFHRLCISCCQLLFPSLLKSCLFYAGYQHRPK